MLVGGSLLVTKDDRKPKIALGIRAKQLGSRLSRNRDAISRPDVERIALSAMDPSGPYGSDDKTVQDRLNQLNQKKAELKELNAQLEPLLNRKSVV